MAPASTPFKLFESGGEGLGSSQRRSCGRQQQSAQGQNGSSLHRETHRLDPENRFKLSGAHGDDRGMTRLLIAASGTGGHLFPALAVAEAMPESWSIRWLGVPDRLETSLVPEAYNQITVKAGGLQGHDRKLIQLFRLIGAGFTVRQLIRQQKIKVVFTTGGYIAAPAILGALLSRVRWFCMNPTRFQAA